MITKNVNAGVSREAIESNVAGVLSNMASRVQYAGEGINEKTTKKGNTVVQKKYDFAVKLGSRVSMTLSDPELITSVEKILLAEKGKKVMGYVICKEMARIADSGKLEKMGFKTVSEFGKAMFGFETSTCNHYVRIGRNFITDDYKVIDGLPELSISHFIELNKFVGENGDVSDIVDMYLEGTLVDGMSTKDVRKALTAKSNVIDGEASVVEETKQTEAGKAENGKTEAVKTETDKKAESSGNETFDVNVECGKALNAISMFAEAMMKLNANGIQVSGYEDKLSVLADMVKALLQ
jgi:hypothetical protein